MRKGLSPRQRILRFCGLAAMILVAGVAAALAAVAPADLAFSVWREGSGIGSRTVTFAEDNGLLIVKTEVDIAVKVAFITAYRRTETLQEEWKDGRLMRFQGRIDDDGDVYTLRIEREDGGLLVSGTGEPYLAPSDALPATYWNRATIETDHLIDVKEGALLSVSAVEDGRDTVTLDGRSVPAFRYRLTGDEQADLWYGQDGVLLRFRTKVRDGSTVEFRAR